MSNMSSESKRHFQEAGVCVLKGVIDTGWCRQLSLAVEQNIEQPGPYGFSYTQEGQDGAYFADFYNWRRFSAYREVCDAGPLGAIAGELTQAESMRFFHEHVLVKEPRTAYPTPWHQDVAVYCVDGTPGVSFWVPLDPVSKEVCPSFLAGSQKDRITYVRPQAGLPEPFEGDPSSYAPLPAVDEHSNPVCSWDLEPGDAIAFDFYTLHNAPANMTDLRRRAISFRLVGGDCRFVERPFPISPPFPEMGLDLKMGDSLPESWFPTVWRRQSSP